jgi:uncharacterized membrane-anchored protein
MKTSALLHAIVATIALVISLSIVPVHAQKSEKTKDAKPEKGKAEVPAISLEGLPEELKQSLERSRKVVESLKFQSGAIPLKDGLATIKLPDNFRYLDPANGKKVLVDLWGNPPSEADMLGLIVPAGFTGAGPDSWAVIITWQEDGYVKDDEAEKINYNDLLKEMKEGETEENAERVKQGYEPITLVGWAAQPRYDRASHKLYWARELKVADYPEHTLNYDIRALGRRGVLSLNAVAGMDQLKNIETDMQQVLGFVEFNEGHRYADYKPGYDKVAAYGIGALVAGKVLAKAGLFKVLLGLLLAGKKFIFIGLIAVGVLLKKLFTGKSGDLEKDETASITGQNS